MNEKKKKLSIISVKPLRFGVNYHCNIPRVDQYHNWQQQKARKKRGDLSRCIRHLPSPTKNTQTLKLGFDWKGTPNPNFHTHAFDFFSFFSKSWTCTSNFFSLSVEGHQESELEQGRSVKETALLKQFTHRAKTNRKNTPTGMLGKLPTKFWMKRNKSSWGICNQEVKLPAELASKYIPPRWSPKNLKQKVLSF